jgi:hypothetical protein
MVNVLFGSGSHPPIPNQTARFAQGAKNAKKIFISTLRVTTVIRDIHNLSDLCVLWFKICPPSSVFAFRPANGRDKSLHYMVGSRNRHVVQGFSPASFDFRPLASGPLILSPSDFLLSSVKP